MLAGEDGPYRAAGGATPWAAGRQVWGPPFPGRRQQLLANPYAGDGIEHPDMHLIHVDEICGLFKLAGLPRDEVKKKVSLYL